MKIMKKVAAVVLAAMASTFAFAEDELFNATAGAVDNDSAYLLDVIDWSRIDFAQAYGLVKFSSEEYGNIGGAYKLKSGAVIHGYWSGDLWEENAHNTFAALYGKDNKAFAAAFTKSNYDYRNYLGPTGIVSGKDITGSFGMQYNDKIAFRASASYLWGDFINDDFTDILLSGEIQYSLSGSSSSGSSSKRSRAKKTEEKPAAAASSNGNESKLGLIAGFRKISLDDADVSGTVFTLTPNYKLQYKISDNVKYGFKAAVPFTFYGGDFDLDSTMGFVLRNGITAKIKPTVTFAAGILTTLPTVNFGDGNNGEFSNRFYLGCGIDVAQNVQLAVSANIKPTNNDDAGSNGESLKEIWEQGFSISLSFKL